MSTPLRERTTLTVCCCRMDYQGCLDSCAVITSGPDEPICRDCVKAEHPQSEFFNPTIKEAPRVRA